MEQTSDKSGNSTGAAARDSVQRLGRRPMGVFKTLNEYATAVPEYQDIPKAVWAAIAVSALTNGGDYLAEARGRVLKEWGILHSNGIVPQKPPCTPTDQTERIAATGDARKERL